MPQTFDSITTFTLGSNNTTIDITGISQSYTDLYVTCGNMRTVTASGWQVSCIFNNDSSTSYGYNTGFFNNLNNWTASTNGSSPSSQWPLSVGNGAGNTYPASFYMNLNNYSDTGRFKTLQSNWVVNLTTSGGNNIFYGTWQSNSAINRITLSTGGSGFIAGTTVSIYGILRA
jgi:hypothetical protein